MQISMVFLSYPLSFSWIVAWRFARNEGQFASSALRHCADPGSIFQSFSRLDQWRWHHYGPLQPPHHREDSTPRSTLSFKSRTFPDNMVQKKGMLSTAEDLSANNPHPYHRQHVSKHFSIFEQHEHSMRTFKKFWRYMLLPYVYTQCNCSVVLNFHPSSFFIQHLKSTQGI